MTTPERVRTLAGAGAGAFTAGPAACIGSFSPRQGLVRSQLEAFRGAARGAPG